MMGTLISTSSYAFDLPIVADLTYQPAEFSKTHSWLMPIFAVGLGCPRWCQMLWGVSGVALYIPWGGVAGPYL
jgi:alpha-1,3-glucan synthase